MSFSVSFAKVGDTIERHCGPARQEVGTTRSLRSFATIPARTDTFFHKDGLSAARGMPI
jgi:hypothetical protein